jgi:glycosyltransferase involved in cell wall biosynthesis
MRVLMTGDTVGGVFTYVCELAGALATRGVETTAALMGRPPSAEQLHALDRAGVAGVHARDCKLEWMDDPWADVERAGEWLLELEAEVEADVVHLNGFAHGGLPWRAPALVVGHSCVLSWWEAVRGGRAPREWDRYRAAVTCGLAAADLVAAPTAAMLQELRRLYAFAAETVVIPNGRRPPRRRFPKQPFVLGAGRLWDEAKNLAALDAAAASIDWPVVVAGDEPDDRARPRHAWLLGRLSNVELEERFAAASIFASPATYEPFGLAALEAGLAGCALVLGDIPSLREVWGDAAAFVDPDDPDALAAELRRLIGDSRWLRERAAAAEARARLFTPERMAAAYLDAYERLQTRALDSERLEVAS